MSDSSDQLVSQQIAHWELTRRLSQQVTTRGLRWPCIAISRAYGAQGLAIGRLAARRLSFDVFDREVIERMAETDSSTERLVHSLDDRAQRELAGWLRRKLETGEISQGDYIEHICKIVVTIGLHGQALIVGRGAHFILNPGQTLRVRTVAPLAVRMAHVSEAHGMTTQQARARLLKADAEREAFARQHFDQDVTAPANYDLVLNTATISVEGCAEVVIAAYRARFGALVGMGSVESGGEGSAVKAPAATP